MVVVVVIGMVVTVVLWNVAAKVWRVVQDVALALVVVEVVHWNVAAKVRRVVQDVALVVALVVGVACVAVTVNVDVVVVFFR